jgi:hypothetical protein
MLEGCSVVAVSACLTQLVTVSAAVQALGNAVQSHTRCAAPMAAMPLLTTTYACTMTGSVWCVCDRHIDSTALLSWPKPKQVRVSSCCCQLCNPAS